MLQPGLTKGTRADNNRRRLNFEIVYNSKEGKRNRIAPTTQGCDCVCILVRVVVYSLMGGGCTVDLVGGSGRRY